MRTSYPSASQMWRKVRFTGTVSVERQNACRETPQLAAIAPGLSPCRFTSCRISHFVSFKRRNCPTPCSAAAHKRSDPPAFCILPSGSDIPAQHNLFPGRPLHAPITFAFMHGINPPLLLDRHLKNPPRLWVYFIIVAQFRQQPFSSLASRRRLNDSIFNTLDGWICDSVLP